MTLAIVPVSSATHGGRSQQEENDQASSETQGIDQTSSEENLHPLRERNQAEAEEGSLVEAVVIGSGGAGEEVEGGGEGGTTSERGAIATATGRAAAAEVREKETEETGTGELATGRPRRGTCLLLRGPAPLRKKVVAKTATEVLAPRESDMYM